MVSGSQGLLGSGGLRVRGAVGSLGLWVSGFWVRGSWGLRVFGPLGLEVARSLGLWV